MGGVGHEGGRIRRGVGPRFDRQDDLFLYRSRHREHGQDRQHDPAAGAQGRSRLPRAGQVPAERLDHLRGQRVAAGGQGRAVQGGGHHRHPSLAHYHSHEAHRDGYSDDDHRHQLAAAEPQSDPRCADDDRGNRRGAGERGPGCRTRREPGEPARLPVSASARAHRVHHFVADRILGGRTGCQPFRRAARCRRGDSLS